MRKVLYFTMKSCGPCKIVGPQIEKICKKYDAPLEEVQMDTSDGQSVGQYFGIFMTPDVVVLDNLRDASKPLDQNKGWSYTKIEASNLPQNLEVYLKPTGRPLEEEPIDGDPMPPVEKKSYSWLWWLAGGYGVYKIFK